MQGEDGALASISKLKDMVNSEMNASDVDTVEEDPQVDYGQVLTRLRSTYELPSGLENAPGKMMTIAACPRAQDPSYRRLVSANENFFACSLRNGAIKVFDQVDGKQLIVRGSGSDVIDMQFSRRNSSMLALVYKDGSCRAYCVVHRVIEGQNAPAEFSARVVFECASGGYRGVEWIDGTTAALFVDEGGAHIYSIASEVEGSESKGSADDATPDSALATSEPVSSASVSPDGSRIACISPSGTVRVFSVGSGDLVASFNAGAKGDGYVFWRCENAPVLITAVARDSKDAKLGCSMRIFDTKTWRELSSLDVLPGDLAIKIGCVDVDETGKFAVLCYAAQSPQGHEDDNGFIVAHIRQPDGQSSREVRRFDYVTPMSCPLKLPILSFSLEQQDPAEPPAVQIYCVHGKPIVLYDVDPESCYTPVPESSLDFGQAASNAAAMAAPGGPVVSAAVEMGDGKKSKDAKAAERSESTPSDPSASDLNDEAGVAEAGPESPNEAVADMLESMGLEVVGEPDGKQGSGYNDASAAGAAGAAGAAASPPIAEIQAMMSSQMAQFAQFVRDDGAQRDKAMFSLLHDMSARLRTLESSRSPGSGGALSRDLAEQVATSVASAVARQVGQQVQAAVPAIVSATAKSLNPQVGQALRQSVHEAFKSRLIPSITDSTRRILAQFEARLSQMSANMQKSSEKLLSEQIAQLRGIRTAADKQLTAVKSALAEMKRRGRESGNTDARAAKAPKPKSVKTLLDNGKTKEALQIALSRQDAKSLELICTRVSAEDFISTGKLTQPILYSLTQQLGFVLAKGTGDAKIKLEWLRFAIPMLQDSVHLQTVLDSVREGVKAVASKPEAARACRDQLKLVKFEIYQLTADQ